MTGVLPRFAPDRTPVPAGRHPPLANPHRSRNSTNIWNRTDQSGGNVVAGLVDEVNVLYGGRVVERADRHELFASPCHPYTHGLLESIPRLDAPPGERLTPINGSVSDNIPWTGGCAFAPRCSREVGACREVSPVLGALPEHRDHLLRCHNPVQPVAAGAGGGSRSPDQEPS